VITPENFNRSRLSKKSNMIIFPDTDSTILSLED
jgi:hypothetical protein